jgi:hypothetical protein
VHDLAITAARAAAPDTLSTPDADQLRRGRAAVLAAVAAHGGTERLASVRTLVYEGDITLNLGGHDLTGLFSLVRVNPSRMSFSTRVLQFESRDVLDGATAWSLTKSDSTTGVQAETTDPAGLRMTFYADVVHQLQFASAAGARAAWRGTEIVGGQTCDLVDYAVPGATRNRVAIETKTHHVVALDAGLVPGPAWADRRVLSDFRIVNGVLLPMVEERLQSGERAARLVASKAGVDREIGDALFQRPKALLPH